LSRRITAHQRRLAVRVALLVGLVSAGCGSSSGPTSPKAARIVDVEMRDNAFEPTAIDVAGGETVTFVFSNVGTVAHDAFIGDADAQAEHEDEMGGDMAGMHHGAPDAVTVAAGKTGKLTHVFKAGDRVLIGCHQPGHYAGGMKIVIRAT
jgi:uncharacterized cupredoxin-like copper-binding protein